MLSVIIPVYNSEKTIITVVKKLEEALSDKIRYEVILIDDGSIDASYDRCMEILKNFKFIKFISLSRNFGQHNAILAGLRFSEGDYIAFMDDDLQTPPDEIWKLIDKIEEGYDVVYANYLQKKHSLLHNFGSRINNMTTNILIKKPKLIKTSSYYIIRKYLVKELISYKGPYPYLTGLIFAASNSIGTVNINHYNRIYGKSNYSFFTLLKLWLNGFTNFSVKPLRFSLFLGLSFSLIAFLSAIFLVVRKLMEPMITLGWTSLIVVILFFAGLNLISIGLIGEYVGRIFMSQNNQPQYVIKEKFNIKENGL